MFFNIKGCIFYPRLGPGALPCPAGTRARNNTEQQTEEEEEEGRGGGGGDRGDERKERETRNEYMYMKRERRGRRELNEEAVVGHMGRFRIYLMHHESMFATFPNRAYSTGGHLRQRWSRLFLFYLHKERFICLYCRYPLASLLSGKKL